MAALDTMSRFTTIMDQWEKEKPQGRPVELIPILTRDSSEDRPEKLAELVEKETEGYYKMDPDPFDDRHPGRANPTCSLGHLLKNLFKNEDFINKLVGEYLIGARDQSELHIVACRLLLDITPGLEISTLFEESDTLVRRLFEWAVSAEEPLRSYSVGLLSGAMELQDLATNFKDSNASLVPLLLKRLHDLKKLSQEETKKGKADETRYFAMFAKSTRNSEQREVHVEDKIVAESTEKPEDKSTSLSATAGTETAKDNSETTETGAAISVDTGAAVSIGTGIANCGDARVAKSADTWVANAAGTRVTNSGDAGVANAVDTRVVNTVDTGVANSKSASTGLEPRPMKRPLSPGASFEGLGIPKRIRNDTFGSVECSNSSWKELQPYVIGSYCMSPLNINMQQRLILQYLTPMAEYQELLATVFENDAMGLIMYYIDLNENRDVRLAFDALRYLANLLCHKKFATEFISLRGVQKLLEVYRPSVAATGVSLCLYYLSYFEFAMEKVCILPDHVLAVLVSYSLWLMECSHQSSRCHAAMFFGHSLSFRIILELFDKKDGLRRLFNLISTLDILNVEQEDSLSDDSLFVSRQSARHVCVALKKYFEAHLAQKADEIRRSHARTDGSSPGSETPAYKALKLPAELTQDNIELMLDHLPLRLHWKPVTGFHQLGGIKLLLQLMAIASAWNNYTGKAETIRSALDVLAVCTVIPKAQLILLESLPIPEDQHTQGVSILLGLAEGEIIPDAEVHKSALNVIINCVCGSVERLGGGVGRYMGLGSKKRLNVRGGEEILGKMWEGIRANNGIMVLLKLLSIKAPITDADAIRALACKALVGLSRSETVRQIMSKLPLFTNGQLQSLMKEPVLQDKRQEHVKFCKYANELIERVSGKRQNAHMDASLDEIRRADIVAQTKIIYQEKELLQLMYDHLISKGYSDTALTLQNEANLPQRSNVPVLHPASPHIYSTCPITPRMSRQLSHPGSSAVSSSHSHVNLGNHGNNARTSPHITPVTPPTPSGPIRINLAHSRTNNSPLAGQHSRVHLTSSQKPSRFSREKELVSVNGLASPSQRKYAVHKSQGDYSMDLDKLVTEYLRKQHALCRNPVATCPPMSLFIPHRCPTPLHKISAPTNLTSRHFRKSAFPPSGGPDGVRCDRKFIYSRFRNIKSYRDGDDEGCFSCCHFSACGQYLILGTYSGDIKLYNIQSGKEALSLSCHNSLICHCEQTRDAKLMLTSALWGRPLSALWRTGDFFENKYHFEEDNHVEFSKQIQDRIVGTKEESAHVYDVNTGQCVVTLYDAEKANGYTRNMATFSPNDDLILNDGVLWDVRAATAIHKFDKFNPNISGSFHPLGMEVIINSEVWDMRTYHLLRTVPALDQCQISFNHAGDVIYGALYHIDDTDDSDDRLRNFYGSTFRTFDATDYSNIATIDVKKNIIDMATDQSDCYLAVIESQKFDDSTGSAEESICRLYEVGKLKDDDDDEGDEEEDEAIEEEEEDEDDDDNSSNIDIISIGESDDDDDNGDDEVGDDQDDDDDDDDADSLGNESDDAIDGDDLEEDDGDLDDDILFELSDLM